jgi:hypothetical protein
MHNSDWEKGKKELTAAILQPSNVSVQQITQRDGEGDDKRKPKGKKKGKTVQQRNGWG